jgi:hypothetical protein
MALMGYAASPTLAQDTPAEGGSAAAGLTAPSASPPASDVASASAAASATPASGSSAEAAPALAAPAESGARGLAAPSGQAAVSVSVTTSGPREDAAPPPAPEHDTTPMGWASLAFRVGIAAVKAGKIENPAYNPAAAAKAAELPAETLAAYGYIGGGACTLLDEQCRTKGRLGVHLVAAIHLGGDGFGWDLEPYATFNSSSQAYGLYTGPKFDIHVADPLYLGFGFGLRAAYLQADGWLLGADLGGRVPFHGVLYLTDDFALELDFGIGVGASGYMSKRIAITNPVTGDMIANAPRMTFGLARAWDLTIGVRFP